MTGLEATDQHLRVKVKRQLSRLKRYLKKKLQGLSEYFWEEKLEEPAPRNRRLFPKHLAILPVEKKVERYVTDYVVDKIEEILGDFFYDILLLDHAHPDEVPKDGRLEKLKRIRIRQIKLHPSKRLYQLGESKARQVASSNTIILILTKRQLYSSQNVFEMEFPLFGEANRALDICIVSLRPLKEKYWGRPENRALLQQRAAKEVVHELGHLIIHELGHCTNPHCVMRHSMKIEQIDEKRLEFCTSCFEKINLIKTKFNI